MEQRGGWAATLALILAAILGVSYLPRKASDSMARGGVAESADGKSGTAASEKAAHSDLVVSCAQIEKRLLRFYAGKVPIPSDAACYKDDATGTKPTFTGEQPVTFAVAIVPNPVETHLPLMFDREISAIQTAAQDTGFSYDGSWFPWYRSDKSYNSLADEEAAVGHQTQIQSQPGIMVFRRGISSTDFGNPYENGLVIFVVAEQPTGGINDAQFRNALLWIEALRGKSVNEPLRIIGPTFSGSLATLYRQLVELKAFDNFHGGIRAFSGTTNADTNVNWFKQRLDEHNQNKDVPLEQLPNQFRTFFESDNLMVDRFLCYMHHEGYDLNHIAILSEDDTAFGSAATNAQKDLQATADRDTSLGRCQGTSSVGEGTPLYLYYPRDIASLRTAYEEQAVFAAGKGQSNAPASSLKSDLSEPAGSEHDTVRSYAGQLTPQAQEAELFGIANVLDNKHIDFIIIRSSNTLDQLFLSEFLRRAYPSGRIVLDGSDLMFRRGMQGASLRGVMLLSPYPLLAWTHDALPTVEGGPSPSQRVFVQDSAEGIYIAGRMLLKEAKGANPSVSISDYAPPPSGNGSYASETNRRPPTWLTVVGHRQFWPLAVLNETSLVHDCKPLLSWLRNDAASDCVPQPYGPRTPSLLNGVPVEPPSYRKAGLPGEMWALLLGCSLLALWHYYCCSYASTFRPPQLLAYFAPVPWLQQPVLIFLGSLLLGCLGISLWFVVQLAFKGLTPGTALGLLFGVLILLLAPFAGVLRNYVLPVISGSSTDDRTALLARIRVWRLRLAIAFLPTLALLAAGRFFYLTYHLHAANRYAVYWRSVFLRSGVSPLLPQVLLLLGFYAWFWFALRGLALFGDDRPVLPRVDDLPSYEAPAGHSVHAHAQHTQVVKAFEVFSQEGAGRNIERNGLPLGLPYLKSLAVTIVIGLVSFGLSLGTPALHTLGDLRFGVLIFVFVGITIGLILADTLQLVNTWSQLRRLLIFLDRLRIRRTLATLRGLYGGSVWKLSGNVLEERYRLISRQFESLRNLHTALQDWHAADANEAQRKQIVLTQLELCEEDGRDFATWYTHLLDDSYKGDDKQSNVTPITEFQEMLAATAGCVMKQLILPAWQSESRSLIRSASAKEEADSFEKLADELPPHVRAAEEFFLLPYMGFIRNVLGRVRTIGLSIVAMFVLVTLAMSSYPFEPLPVIGAVFLVLFAIVGTSLVVAYAGMSRDATLSRIADTNPGELGWDFWVKMIALGTGPLFGLLTTLFPSLTDFIVSFLQPGAQAIK